MNNAWSNWRSKKLSKLQKKKKKERRGDWDYFDQREMK
jgi:hypothetical protein